jgi:putative membrane protein
MKAGSRIRVLGYFLGFAGAALLTALIIREGAARVVAALAAASWAVPVVVAINIPRFFSDGAAWLALVPGPDRPRLLTAVWVRWVGGSVNDFLPSARLGGDILTARLATIRAGLSPTLAAGVAVVNMTVSVTLRILVTIGVLFLIAGVTGLAHLYVPTFLAGLTALIAVLAFYLVQRFGFFRLVTGVTSRLKRRFQIVERASLPPSLKLRRTSARPTGLGWSSLSQSGANFDDTVRRLYSRLPALLVSALFWIVSWLIGCIETWVALFALGIHTSFVVALIVETAGQSIRSVFFIVPAGLGIFEGGMVIICSLLGISGNVALALSLIRRAREALFSGTGLIIWQFVEARRVLSRAKEAAPS